MTKPFVRAATLTVACACLLAPRIASSQTAPYMIGLSIPPSTVGTCMPHRPAAARGQGGPLLLRESHLSIKTRAPGGDREISAFVDAAGVVRGYSDLVMRQTGLTSSESEQVLASFAPNGVVEGTIRHGRTTMPPPDLRSGIPLDSAMRAMRAHAKQTSTKVPLSAADVARVRAVSDWLVKRCPPQ